MMFELLSQTPDDQDIGKVTADGAYDTRRCHDAIAICNAHAVVPPRKNAKPWTSTSAGAIARTKRSRHPDTWALPYGNGGVYTTVEAASKRNLSGSGCA